MACVVDDEQHHAAVVHRAAVMSWAKVPSGKNVHDSARVHEGDAPGRRRPCRVEAGRPDKYSTVYSIQCTDGYDQLHWITSKNHAWGGRGGHVEVSC